MAPAALLSLSALVAAKLSEARVTPAASLPMAAAQPTIDLDESIAALAARAHVSAHNKDMLQDKMLQQGVGNVAELLTAIQGGTSATALGFSPAALALCERVLPDKTLRSAEAAAVALAAPPSLSSLKSNATISVSPASLCMLGCSCEGGVSVWWREWDR